MRRISLVVVMVAALALAACGAEDEESGPAQQPATTEQSATAPEERAEAGPESKPEGTAITLRDSEFGPMLFDSRRQAIYVFEDDRRDQTNCYGECAEAWPPVYTKGAPQAGDGVRAGLLGTIRRRDGRSQVTYAGKPLYFYAHEGPGQVLCHNVDLNGGLWWVVGADGEPRPA
jgi:predicted lipoprotein with Yx(FWY)xxD motif